MLEIFNAQATAESLIGWLKEKIEAAGAEGGVFGLSGGIDSTVVAALMKRAFPEASLGILLPAESLPADREDALKVAEILELPTLTIDLSATLAQFHEEMEKCGLPRDRMATSNAKARLRMTALHYAATLRHSLVVGTGNRAELYVGYFTKYGDGGVDLLPLACLVKSQVKEVARYLGLPDELVERTPSAGLYPGQTDEKELGFSYDQLDRYILTGEIDDVTVKAKIDRMHRLSRHKREAIPCPSF